MSEPKRQRLVVLISGRGSNLVALIEALCHPHFAQADIVGVVSDQTKAAGLQKAQKAGIHTSIVPRDEFSTKETFETELSRVIQSYHPDWVILAGFMRVLSSEFLSPFLGRMINIHPSLLPKYRGLHTHERVLEAKDSHHGASIHFVTPTLDGGPVISQARMSVAPSKDPDDLAARLLPLEHQLMVATVALLIGCEVKCDDDSIFINGQALEKPLVLGVDLDLFGVLGMER